MTGKGILVVDDDPAILDILRDALEGQGHIVETAPSAEKAIQLILANSYAAAVLDFNLPDGDGISLHRQIREIDQKLAAHTIFMSGQLQSQDNLHYYASQGAGFFVPKPFDLQDVLAAIRKVSETLD